MRAGRSEAAGLILATYIKEDLTLKFERIPYYAAKHHISNTFTPNSSQQSIGETSSAWAGVTI